MSRNLERTFSVAMPVERVWSAMTDPDELNRWYFPFRVAEDGSTRTEILGVERQAEVVAYEPPAAAWVRHGQISRGTARLGARLPVAFDVLS